MLGKISYRQEYYMAPNFKDLSEEVSTPRSKICSMYNGVYFLIDENAELGLSNISVHGFTIEKSTIKVADLHYFLQLRVYRRFASKKFSCGHIPR